MRASGHRGEYPLGRHRSEALEQPRETRKPVAASSFDPDINNSFARMSFKIAGSASVRSVSNASTQTDDVPLGPKQEMMQEASEEMALPRQATKTNADFQSAETSEKNELRQQLVTNERRAEIIKQRKDREEREETEKKERIRTKLDALDSAPADKKLSTGNPIAQNSSSSTTNIASAPSLLEAKSGNIAQFKAEEGHNPDAISSAAYVAPHVRPKTSRRADENIDPGKEDERQPPANESSKASQEFARAHSKISKPQLPSSFLSKWGAKKATAAPKTQSHN